PATETTMSSRLRSNRDPQVRDGRRTRDRWREVLATRRVARPNFYPTLNGARPTPTAQPIPSPQPTTAPTSAPTSNAIPEGVDDIDN
ncbi:MAG: hypothetical protein MI924_00095, partial [Chloroflexales bacterium]|nr:hypothetical protein [Chloroflexales bacterium]